MKTYETFSEAAQELVNNDEVIKTVIELRSKYKKDSKALTDEQMIESYQEVLKKQLCDNKVVSINKRPFGFTIKVGRDKVRIVWNDVSKGSTAQLVASIVKK